MRMVRRIAITVSICCSVAVVEAGKSWPKGPAYDGLRSMGMGNTTVAVTTDRTAIFHNPAGLALLRDKLQVSLAPAIFSINGKVGEYVNFAAQYADSLNPDDMTTTVIDSMSGLDGKWVGLEYLPEFTIAKKNLGFGFYSLWPADLRLEMSHLVPKFALKGQRDMVFTWAVGVPLKNENHTMGLSLEYVRRMPLREYLSKYTETFELSDDFSKSVLSTIGVVGGKAAVEHGASFDAGFMHQVKGFRFAYALKDFFGVVGGNMVIPQLDIGAAYYFPMIEDVAFLRNIIVALEISDIWGFQEKGIYEQFPKKLHCGAEIDLNYIAFRSGLNQGYPTLGVGVAAGPVTIDYVYFTEETGTFAGQQPRSRHIFSLGFGFDIDDGMVNMNLTSGEEQ